MAEYNPNGTIEVIKVTLENVNELAERTGRPAEALLEDYFNAKASQEIFCVTLGLP